MPTLLDWQYALPLCTRRLIRPHPQSPRGGVHLTCFKPMRYLAAANVWRCACGSQEAGELVAARRAALEERAA